MFKSVFFLALACCCLFIPCVRAQELTMAGIETAAGYEVPLTVADARQMLYTIMHGDSAVEFLLTRMSSIQDLNIRGLCELTQMSDFSSESRRKIMERGVEVLNCETYTNKELCMMSKAISSYGSYSSTEFVCSMMDKLETIDIKKLSTLAEAAGHNSYERKRILDRGLELIAKSSTEGTTKAMLAIGEAKSETELTTRSETESKFRLKGLLKRLVRR